MKKKPKTKFYVLECASEDCDAEFYLNDIPIVRRGPKLGPFYGGQSNQYLIDGCNEIAIVVNPGPTPSQALSRKSVRFPRVSIKPAKVTARLALYPFGAVVGGPDAKELMKVEWVSSSDEPTVYPKVVSCESDLGELFGSWEWESAPRLELNDPTRKEIVKFVENLHLSLAAGDPELFIDLGAPRLNDMEKAYGQDPGSKSEMLRNIMQVDVQESWWGMQALAPGQYDFRLCARDRMVEVIGKDWKPVITEEADDDGGVGSYPMLLSKIKDKWRIVR